MGIQSYTPDPRREMLTSISLRLSSPQYRKIPHCYCTANQLFAKVLEKRMELVGTSVDYGDRERLSVNYVQ